MISIAVSASTQQTRDGQTVPTTGTGSISGTVVQADLAATPVRRGVLRLTGNAVRGGVLYALTDESGSFSISALPPGQFVVTAERPGYLASSYGAKHAGGPGTPIALAAGQRVEGLRISLVRGSVVSGMVVDELGHGAPGLAVHVLRYETLADTGERLPRPVESDAATSISDADGRYRLYGLEPGEYLVSVSPAKPVPEISAHIITDADIGWATLLLRTPAGATMPVDRREKDTPARRKTFSNAPLYYPSAGSIAEASRITVGVAAELAGIDIALHPLRTAMVSGQIAGPVGAVRGGGTVNLVDPVSTFQAGTHWASDGTFVFRGVPPGQYLVVATPDQSPLRGVADLFVDGGEVSLTVPLSAGGTIAGRLVFEGASPPDPQLVRLTLTGTRHTDMMYSTPPPRSDGTFVFPGVPAGTYRLSATLLGSAQPGWRAKSAMLGDVDLFDGPILVRVSESISGIVVTVANTRSEISGAIVDGIGRPAVDFTVLVFATDSALRGPQSRRTQWMRPNTQGRFLIRDLPAGDYIIAAVADLEAGQWTDQAFLAELAPFGIKVSLGDGEKKTQNIRVGGGL
jgi:hypothetical protein